MGVDDEESGNKLIVELQARWFQVFVSFLYGSCLTRVKREISSDGLEGYNRTSWRAYTGRKQRVECVIYDVVFVSKFQFPSAQKAVRVHLPSLLTLAKQDNQWKVPTLCKFGMEGPFNFRLDRVISDICRSQIIWSYTEVPKWWDNVFYLNHTFWLD